MTAASTSDARKRNAERAQGHVDFDGTPLVDSPRSELDQVVEDLAIDEEPHIERGTE